MQSKPDHITELIIKQLNGELTAEEGRELRSWMDESSRNKVIAEEFTNEFQLHAGIKEMYGVEGRVWERLKSAMGHKQLEETKVIKMQPWKRWIAAAVILFVVCGLLFVVSRNPKQDIPPTIAITRDVSAPKGTKAIITLADGRTISLDSLNSGLLAKEGEVSVVKNNKGEIVYQTTTEGKQTKVGYHTLINPKGSKVETLLLGDGSRVWLNAESSIRFPAVFAGTDRVVEITGEAYFEVAHNANQPFIVSVNDMQVEVLGTHFNINSYADEGAMKTTLLEGKVRVTKGSSIAILKPGQQSIAIPNGGLKMENGVDIDAVMAWKNGYFHFNGASLQEVMRQIVRWYDVEVEYQGNIPQRKFGGEISRASNLSQVLKILEESKVHFTIENKKIIVRP